MDSIIARNFRCFQQEIDIPLRKINLLVGENSSGKTTFLALKRLAWDVWNNNKIFEKQDLDFNEDPFSLGAFEQIASVSKHPSDNTFEIGFKVNLPEKIINDHPEINSKFFTVKAIFIEWKAQPKLSKWSLCMGDYGMEITYEQDNRPVVTFTTPSGISYLNNDFGIFMSSRSPVNFLKNLQYILKTKIFRDDDQDFPFNFEGTPPTESELLLLSEIITLSSEKIGNRPYAFSPIRTKPLRTYDPLQYKITSDGAHVPMVLAEMASSREGWKKFHKFFNDFGKHSGLFTNIRVKRLGKGLSSPFQILVKASNKSFNIIDVGYGVSQILPIIVDYLNKGFGNTYLIQQPEIHLHPKAQAEMGSFFAYFAGEHKDRFLIETHSDYLIDRIRMEVRDKNAGITKEDVLILFFERTSEGVNIHPIEIDEDGQIINAPTNYRDFFLDEQRRLIWG